LGDFDDEPLRQFLVDKELIEVRDHFFHNRIHAVLKADFWEPRSILAFR